MIPISFPLRRRRSLAVDEHLLAKVLLAGRIVVVDVDRAQEPGLRHKRGHRLLHRLRHATTVLLRIAEREEHVRKVIVAIGLLDRQKREVRIRQRHMEARAETIRDPMVMLDRANPPPRAN